MFRSLSLLSGFLFSALVAFSQGNSLYFPPKTGNTWQTLSPASQGFCQERVDSLYTFLEAKNTKSFVLLKDGRIVLEKYFNTFTPDSFWYWASAGKSLTAFLVGQALDEGILQLNAPTSQYLGTGWTSCPPAKEAAITLRHQLTMTTGLDDGVSDDNCITPACLTYKADAGTRWAYHNAPYRLLHDVISAASGQTINQFTQSRVLAKTGMKGYWINHIMYGRARDMARFGLLVQANGVWDGDTLLHDPAYFQQMRTPSQTLNKSYGYLWWLNGQPNFMLPAVQFVLPGSLYPAAPADMFSALGKNDQKIHVVPSKGWVVVRQGNASGIVGPGGGEVPIAFDNELWEHLNALTCLPSATQAPSLTQLRVWPNPASDGWQLQTDAAIRRIELCDAQGRLVRTRDADAATSFFMDAAGLPDGVFSLRAYTQEGVITMKVMKGAWGE